jgi:hypothetical protein
MLKRDGKSLDHVECVLGDVTDDKINFEFDGESHRADRTTIAGFIFYRRDSESQVEPRLTLKSRSGLVANAAAVMLAGGVVRFTTAGGTEIEWPVDDIYLADYSAGKILYLSDMEPVSQQWTPLIGLPAGAEVAARYGEPRRDQSAYGGSLSLLARDGLSVSSSEAPQLFTKGLAIRSRTELVYRLPGGFRRLKAVAGIDPAARASGNVRLEIVGDDQSLLTTNVAGGDAPHDIDLDVSGVKRLKLVVDYGTNLDTGDWLNLCEARLLK